MKEHQDNRKSLEQSTKKQVQQMTAQLQEASISQKQAERECVSLRDGVKSLRDAWAREIKAVKDEWKKGVERERQEREEAVCFPFPQQKKK